MRCGLVRLLRLLEDVLDVDGHGDRGDGWAMGPKSWLSRLLARSRIVSAMGMRGRPNRALMMMVKLA